MEEVMITFEEIQKETIYIAVEIINSNTTYNEIENGEKTRSPEQVEEELLNNKTTSYFIKLDDTYIGVIDYLPLNVKDNHPWLGLLMIHADYQQFGFGSSAYVLFEKLLQEQGVETLRLGVLQENRQARHFWERLGFTFYETKEKDNKQIDCLEKKLT
jgi:ribosomal protein S18 acetylase RimI-like enzyme